MTTNYLELSLLLIGALGLAAWFGCRPRAERPLVVVLSGDTAGWIAPDNVWNVAHIEGQPLDW